MNRKIFSLKKILSVKVIYSLIGLAALLIIVKLFSFSTIEEKEDLSYQQNFNLNYKIYSLIIPTSLNFSGERVPIENFEVRERLDRELLVNTYWQSSSLLYIKRSNRWFPVIEEILMANNIPPDFKYLALIESGFTNTVSPAGATGFWQFMKAAGKEYGLEINHEVDERYHVKKSTEAACKYLRDAYEKFGSWTLAAASYNLGMAGIAKQMERQKATDYYDLVLPDETSRYLFRILAAKEILENTKKYGFHVRENDLYPQIATHEIAIDSGIPDIADFAMAHGINYKMLKTFNPWLRDTYLSNKHRKEYLIQIPDKKFIESLNDAVPPKKNNPALSPDSLPDND